MGLAGELAGLRGPARARKLRAIVTQRLQRATISRERLFWQTALLRLNACKKRGDRG